MSTMAISSANWLKRARASTGLRAVGKLAGATALGQLAIMASLPLLTRLYDPAAFGLHALVTAFVGIASVGACFCLDLAIMTGKDDQAADELFAAAMLSAPIAAGISVLAMGALVAAGMLGFGQLPWWSVVVAAAMVLLNGLYLASRYRTLREQRYGALARASLAQNTGRALAPIGWSFILSGWFGLTIGELTGRCLGVYGLLRPLTAQWRKTSGRGSLSAWWRVIVREKRFTVVLLGLVLVDASASLLIAPLLGASFGARAAGEYFLVSMILVAPSALVGTAVADVIHSRGARLHIEAPSELPRFTRKAALGLLAAGCGIYLPVFAFAPHVLPLVLGQKWPLAAPIAQALTPFMIVAFVASPCSRLLAAVGKPQLKVWSDGLRLVGVPLIIHTCGTRGVPFLDAMGYLSWFLAAAYLLYFAMTLFAVQPGTDTHDARR